MLRIVIPAPVTEDWDEVNEEFIYRPDGKEQVLLFEALLIPPLFSFLLCIWKK